MNSLLRCYQKLLQNFPIGVQAIQTGLLMGSGDLIAQVFVEKKDFEKYDVARTLKYTFIGTCFVGPPLRVWYGALEKFFGNEGKLAAVKKVTADQLLFAPVFLGFIMGVIGIGQGNTLNEITDRMKHDYPDVLINNYKLWPAVQLCNFYIVPLQYQVVTVQFVAIIWNTYLSWKMNQSIPVREMLPRKVWTPENGLGYEMRGRHILAGYSGNSVLGGLFIRLFNFINTRFAGPFNLTEFKL